MLPFLTPKCVELPIYLPCWKWLSPLSCPLPTCCLLPQSVILEVSIVLHAEKQLQWTGERRQKEEGLCYNGFRDHLGCIDQVKGLLHS